MALIAYERRQETEYLKILTLVNAIIQVGHMISANISGEAYSGSEKVNKLLDSLKDFMLPSLAEEKEDAAEKAKRILSRETQPLKIKIMGNDKKRPGRVKIGGGR